MSKPGQIQAREADSWRTDCRAALQQANRDLSPSRVMLADSVSDSPYSALGT